MRGATRRVRPPPGPPIVYGHRGCSAVAPENTLAAFGALAELARCYGSRSAAVVRPSADAPALRIGVELDVQRSADGELVVFHDWDLRRIAGRDARIMQTDYRQLAAIDVGSWFDARFAAERIPRLDDVFALLGDAVVYDIELKHQRRGETELEAAVACAIDRHALQERCMVSSFNPYALRAFGCRAPRIPLALIYANDPAVPWVLRRGAGRFMVAVDVLKPRRQQAAAALRKPRIGRRLPVLPWTINDPQEALALIRRGCVGVISDDPAAVAAAIRDRGDTFSATAN
ncbi:MAG: glycerophosphodiester phosphodiesterase [Spirochaetaceae bacterium]|nr:MAG: glycerophosphodiester phosphodiesterase [Spirochaetaceae bacterium]